MYLPCIYDNVEIGCKYILNVITNYPCFEQWSFERLGWNTEAHYIDYHSASQRHTVNLLQHTCIVNGLSPQWQKILRQGIALDLFFALKRWEGHCVSSSSDTFYTEVEMVCESKFERCQNLEKLLRNAFL